MARIITADPLFDFQPFHQFPTVVQTPEAARIPAWNEACFLSAVLWQRMDDNIDEILDQLHKTAKKIEFKIVPAQLFSNVFFALHLETVLMWWHLDCVLRLQKDLQE